MIMKGDSIMKIEKIWFTDKAVCIRTEDGREGQELLSNYPRLRHATFRELENFEADEYGIHWPALDEDLCFDGFFEQKEPTALYKFFMAHPELNVSAIARRMGISQSLMAQYISGKKNPSKTRVEEILETVRSVGRELAMA